jgi:hypothetical protein
VGNTGSMAVQRAKGTVTGGRRADAGVIRVSARDMVGLSLCGEHYGAPYDLLAAALDVQAARLRGIVARWRAAGLARTGSLGPGPSWCWLTPAGMAAAGLPYPAAPPKLARLAHCRAVLAARLWLASGQAYRDEGVRDPAAGVAAQPCHRGLRGPHRVGLAIAERYVHPASASAMVTAAPTPKAPPTTTATLPARFARSSR